MYRCTSRTLVTLLVAIGTGLTFTSTAHAVTYDAMTLLPTVALEFSPRTGTFIEGSTFDVPLTLNTRGASVNTLNITVTFDADKLSIVRPAGGVSIIGLWLEPPAYDNVRGTVTYVGAIPNGIVTSSGVIGTITFKAKATGNATVAVRTESTVLLNDGLGSQARVEYGRASYAVVPKAPEGLAIYSDTHPSQETWYNNPNPVFAWEGTGSAEGYSVVFDAKPNTVPATEITTTVSSASFGPVKDGLWYLHVRERRAGVWSAPSHYLVRIDTVPPASFDPKVSYVLAAPVAVERALVSFFTTDNLSGIDHYEIGVINKDSPETQSPIFIEAESPYQLPRLGEAGARVIVRAFDKAGNSRDENISVSASPSFISSLLKHYGIFLLIVIVLLLLLGFILHYLYGHHILRHLGRAFTILKEEEKKEEKPLEP